MYKVTYLFLIAAILIATAVGCNQGGSKGEAIDTATSGKITIAADESFRPLVDSQIHVFEGTYKNADIEVKYMSEDEAVRSLLAGDARLAIVSRELKPEEKQVLVNAKINPDRVEKIAIDGVALIVNRQNPDSLLTIQQLLKIFKGEIKTWKDLGGKGSAQPITIVFDNSGSSNYNYLVKRFGVSEKSNIKVFATKSNQEVIDYVKRTPNAMGVIGTNWVSDSDDPAQQRFSSAIRVVSVGEGTPKSPDEYFQPYQAYLSLEQYPLRRDVLVLSREARVGLGTGFTSFVAGSKGQRIVLKGGLLPATMPVRLVGTKEGEL